MSADAFSIQEEPATTASVQNAPPLPAPPVAPPVADWTQAAAAAGADAAAPETPEVVDHAAEKAAEQAARDAENLQLAELLTTVQFWACGMYAAAKAKYPEFVPPEVPPQGRQIVVGAYQQMLAYGGAAIQLPPWVMGLVMPAATVISVAVGVGRGYADLAREQKTARAAAANGSG
jgi:hypothetical protein